MKLTKKQEVFINALRREHAWLKEEGFLSSPIRNLELSKEERSYFKRIQNKEKVINKIAIELKKYNLYLYKDNSNFGTLYHRYEFILSS